MDALLRTRLHRLGFQIANLWFGTQHGTIVLKSPRFPRGGSGTVGGIIGTVPVPPFWVIYPGAEIALILGHYFGNNGFLFGVFVICAGPPLIWHNYLRKKFQPRSVTDEDIQAYEGKTHFPDIPEPHPLETQPTIGIDSMLMSYGLSEIKVKPGWIARALNQVMSLGGGIFVPGAFMIYAYVKGWQVRDQQARLLLETYFQYHTTVYVMYVRGYKNQLEHDILEMEQEQPDLMRMRTRAAIGREVIEYELKIEELSSVEDMLTIDAFDIREQVERREISAERGEWLIRRLLSRCDVIMGGIEQPSNSYVDGIRWMFATVRRDREARRRWSEREKARKQEAIPAQAR